MKTAAPTMHSPFAAQKPKSSAPSSGHMNPFSKHPEPKSPKIVHKINVGRSVNGGFELEHQHSNFDHPSEQHQAPDGYGALTHMAKHMGIHDVEIKRKAAAQEERAEPPAERAREAATPGAEAAEEAGGEY